MKTTLTLMLLVGFVFSAGAQININQPARFKTKIICYDGKLGSGASCSAINFDPQGAYPGRGSTDQSLSVSTEGNELGLSWEFVGRDGDRDVYRFTIRRTTTKGVPGKVTTSFSKEVRFAGVQALVFKDDFHTVMIGSPSEKELKDARPKREATAHASGGGDEP